MGQGHSSGLNAKRRNKTKPNRTVQNVQMKIIPILMMTTNDNFWLIYNYMKSMLYDMSHSLLFHTCNAFRLFWHSFPVNLQSSLRLKLPVFSCRKDERTNANQLNFYDDVWHNLSYILWNNEWKLNYATYTLKKIWSFK